MPKEEENNLKDDKKQKKETVEEQDLQVPKAEEVETPSAMEEDFSPEQQMQDLQIDQIEQESKEQENVDINTPVTVQPVQFTSFEDLNQAQGEVNKNLDILMDIKLQLTVELGRTELSVKKVLELTRGSIIELEKVAGEPVELYANGKLVANGEVVVIEDNFGLRITSITDPEDRLKGI